MVTKKYYKVLGKAGNPLRAFFSNYDWPEIGKWTERIDTIVPCYSGYHVCELEDLTKWVTYGDALYEVEVIGPGVRHEFNKTVFSQVRLAKYLGEVTPLLHRLDSYSKPKLLSLPGLDVSRVYMFSSMPAIYNMDYDMERMPAFSRVTTGNLRKFRIDCANKLLQLLQGEDNEE